MRRNNAPLTANYRQVSFNPYTGQVLLDRMRYSGVLGWMTNLHYYLLVGPTGLLVSGWMAIGLLLLCVTGLILWWPGVRRWASGLVLRRRASWRRINWDLHVVIGFWGNALLLVITLTGVYFAFPDTVRDLVVSLSGSTPPITAKPKATAHAGSTVLTIDEAIDSARKALPPNAPPDYFFLPDRSAAVIAPYSATGYYAGTAPFSQLVQVSLDSHTGAVLSLTDTREQIVGMRVIQYFFAVHFGSFGGAGIFGFIVKLVWVALGITPALLAVTGLIMYWNRKLRPLLRRNIIH